MIRPWVAVLTSFHNTPIFGRIWLIVAALGAYSALVVLFDVNYMSGIKTVGAQIHTVLGLVLGLLLVFRTNTSYDRWWEGRKLWGQLVNDSRNLAIKVQTCVKAPVAEKQELGQWLIDFAYALKAHLRGGVKLAELPGFEQTSDAPNHVPAYLAQRIYHRLEAWRRANQLGGFELWFLDQHAGGLMVICGACERIQKTPISVSYRWFIRQLIAIYLVTLPWGLIEDFQWWTILDMLMLAYFMIGVEVIAEEIEDPFGLSEDDLMLDDICRTIKSGVTEILARSESFDAQPVETADTPPAKALVSTSASTAWATPADGDLGPDDG
jgi:putative membrane protein